MQVYGLFGALEDMSLDEIKRQFDTNCLQCNKNYLEACPVDRKQKNGIMINVTSIAGVVGIPAECIYVSSEICIRGID